MPWENNLLLRPKNRTRHWDTNPLLRPRACTTGTRNWLDLPYEMTLLIMTKLGAFHILTSAQKVCRLWHSISMDPFLWRTIDMCNLGREKYMAYDLRKMCRHAVDRSRGQLVDFEVQGFGVNGLLNYILDSGCHLRCLCLVQCNDDSDWEFLELRKMAPKLSVLEELDLTFCHISIFELEAIGQSCPLLRSLKLRGGRSMGNEAAYIISGNMPMLRHLELYEDSLNHEGLLAILKGCPHLEYLDLQNCRHLKLQGKLRRKCVRRIKNLRYLDASTQEYYRFSSGRLLKSSKDYADISSRILWTSKDADQDENENMFKKGEGEVPKGSTVEYDEMQDYWEDIDAMWAIAKSKRLHQRKRNKPKGFQGYHREKKNTKSNEKKHGRKTKTGRRIEHESIVCFEKEFG
ncbi:F-box protein SKIP19-like [Arachis stenosperma]|uniref:F-box protein SKIP19-like n=1 Tax=Arachis stenosperma TaxID=217475 RepID=UPI0025AC7299|nr:F-box protein SKIP19-like [Arachis stenosperma]